MTPLVHSSQRHPHGGPSLNLCDVSFSSAKGLAAAHTPRPVASWSGPWTPATAPSRCAAGGTDSDWGCCGAAPWTTATGAPAPVRQAKKRRTWGVFPPKGYKTEAQEGGGAGEVGSKKKISKKNLRKKISKKLNDLKRPITPKIHLEGVRRMHATTGMLVQVPGFESRNREKHLKKERVWLL